MFNPNGKFQFKLNDRITQLVAIELLAGLGLSSAFTAIRSLNWPLAHDVPLMHYIAWRILAGDIPYKEIFDINMPGTYLIHMFVITVFGSGDLGWYLFNLVWVSFATLSIALYCSPHGRWAMAFASLLFLTVYFGSPIYDMGQRDFLIFPFLILGAHFLARSIETGNEKGYLFFSGVAIGCAVTIKPYALILLLFFALIDLWNSYKVSKDILKRLAALICGALIAPVAIVFWLIAAGAFLPFSELLTQYLLPFYSRLEPAAFSSLVAALATRLLLALPVLLLLPLALSAEPSPKRLRYIILFACTVYGLLHYVIQDKGWSYHLFPFTFFLITLSGMALGDLFIKKRQHLKTLALISQSLIYIPLIHMCVFNGLAVISLSVTKPLAEQLINDLSTYSLTEHDTVQVLDTTEGGIHALYTLHVRQPTRFIYDFQFFHDTDQDFIKRLKAEFIKKLELSPPKLIAIFSYAWLPPHSIERLNSFPEFVAFLNANYAPSIVRDGYTIYIAKDAKIPP